MMMMMVVVVRDLRTTREKAQKKGKPIPIADIQRLDRVRLFAYLVCVYRSLAHMLLMGLRAVQNEAKYQESRTQYLQMNDRVCRQLQLAHATRQHVMDPIFSQVPDTSPAQHASPHLTCWLCPQNTLS